LGLYTVEQPLTFLPLMSTSFFLLMAGYVAEVKEENHQKEPQPKIRTS
jgi:hypothetical protein